MRLADAFIVGFAIAVIATMIIAGFVANGRRGQRLDADVAACTALGGEAHLRRSGDAFVLSECWIINKERR